MDGNKFKIWLTRFDPINWLKCRENDKVFICQFLVKTHDLKMCRLNYSYGHSFCSSVDAVLTVFSVLSGRRLVWPTFDRLPLKKLKVRYCYSRLFVMAHSKISIAGENERIRTRRETLDSLQEAQLKS